MPCSGNKLGVSFGTPVAVPLPIGLSEYNSAGLLACRSDAIEGVVSGITLDRYSLPRPLGYAF